jgi:hypothetical protein
VERLRRKKRKRVQPEIREVIVEKIVERPVETIRNVPFEKIVEVPVEIFRDVEREPRIIEKIVEVPRIEYIDRPYP